MNRLWRSCWKSGSIERLLPLPPWLARRLGALLAVAILAQPAPASEADPVILLVPGMVWEVETAPTTGLGKVAGSAPWQSLISYLRGRGYPFGGVIRASGVNIRLPEGLQATDTTVKDPRRARLFFLEFSPAANSDGLAFRALELADCLRELHRFTGRPLYLVTHSAGGLVARVVLQQACPGVGEVKGVKRLITIAAPHLGAAMATDVGDLFGTRVTCLKPEAELLRRLNSDLELPTGCVYTALIIRGLGRAARGEGAAYKDLLDATALAAVPVEFREGGDQIVHVQSANLRWAACARRYEEAAKQAIHAIVIRTGGSTGIPGLLKGNSLHVTALDEKLVHSWIGKLLADDGQFWSGVTGEDLERWVTWQATGTAFALMENHVLSYARVREVEKIFPECCDETRRAGMTHAFRFAGIVQSLSSRPGPLFDRVTGTMSLTLDRFGRINRVHAEVSAAAPKGDAPQ